MTTVEDILEHHGVKGQKWGVRRDRGHEGESAKLKTIARADKKFERNMNTFNTVLKIHNRAAVLTNKNDIDRINNKPEYKDKDFSRDTPLRRQYYKEHQKAFLDNIERAANEFGTNASGTKKYGILEGQNGSWDIYLKDVKHADINSSPLILFTAHPIYDKGKIVRIGGATIAHDDSLISEFLSHHGIKGMHWGVRKDRAGSSEPQSVNLHMNRVNQITKTSGGANHPASEDAIRTKTALQKARSSGTQALSTKELQDVVNRMNLEQQYSRLASSKSTVDRGHQKVKQILQLGKTMADVYNTANSPAGKAIRSALKS